MKRRLLAIEDMEFYELFCALETDDFEFHVVTAWAKKDIRKSAFAEGETPRICWLQPDKEPSLYYLRCLIYAVLTPGLKILHLKSDPVYKTY